MKDERTDSEKGRNGDMGRYFISPSPLRPFPLSLFFILQP